MDPLDLVGDVLDGQFKVEEFVGEGALSVVYRGRNEALDAPVAVKCLDLPSTLDAAIAGSVVASFQEGCKLHYRLARGHLAIAQTFASGTTVAPRTGVQVPYIVREWFDGESLARDLRRRRAEGEGGRSLAETIALFEPIASALTYAHKEDATHLSLMPSNLFLAKHEDEVSLKLLDFGVGRVVDEVASTRDGTPPPRIRLLLPTYAAPEQLLSSIGPTGPWTDVYALALVLLEVLADKTVMGEKDPSALIARALNKLARPTPASLGVELPRGVERLFERALALEPESRPASVAELWAELVAEARPGRSDRRKLGVFLRRFRRARRVDARRRTEPPESFPPDEPPTAKARGVVAMLTGARHRASTRPPPPAAVPQRPRFPAPTTSPAPPVPPKQTASPPAPAVAAAVPLPPKIPRAPTLLGIAPPPPAARPLPHVPPPEPAVTIPASPEPARTKPPPAPELPSVIVAPPDSAAAIPPAIAPPLAPPPPLSPPIALAPAPAPVFESTGRLEPYVVPVKALVASAVAFVRRRPIDRRVLVGGAAGAAALLALLVVVIALASRSPHGTTATAATATAAPTATATATASATATATATETASSPTPGVFEKRVALAAIAENTKDLSDCRGHHPGGVWGKGQVGVVFRNDGTVRYVLMSAPFLGPEGKCVARHIKETRIDPFVGIIGPIYANFVIPY